MAQFELQDYCYKMIHFTLNNIYNYSINRNINFEIIPNIVNELNYTFSLSGFFILFSALKF